MWFSGILQIVVVILVYMGKDKYTTHACDEACRSALIRELKTFFIIDNKMLTDDTFKNALQELKKEIIDELKVDNPQVSNNNIQPQLELINSNIIKIGNKVELIEEKLYSIDQKADTETNAEKGHILEPIETKLNDIRGAMEYLGSELVEVNQMLITIDSNTESLPERASLSQINTQNVRDMQHNIYEEFKELQNYTSISFEEIYEEIKELKNDTCLSFEEISREMNNIRNITEYMEDCISTREIIEELKSQGNATLQEIQKFNQVSKSFIISVDNLTSQISNVFQQEIASVIGPLEALNSQGNTTLQEIEYVKDEISMVNNVSKLYRSAVDNLSSQIRKEFKSSFATVTGSLKDLNSQANATLQEIEFMKDEMIMLNATELHQNIFVISDQINYIETTLNKSAEKINEIYKCTPKPVLPWHTVGSDRFVRLAEKKTWNDARIVCQNNCLDLFKPKDVVAVAKYVDEKLGNQYHWLAARGDGNRQVWVTTDEVVNKTEPWHSSSSYDSVGTDRCLAAATCCGYPEARRVLNTASCTTTYPALCG